MKKRSVVLNGHGTSVTLEDAFWDALKTIATGKNISLNTLITTIDAARNPGDNLSSHIRIYILKWYQTLKDS
ncbi:MAG: ribbon-helix-helix domain-containing protein [Alphaproteobacteria bacterium]|nr:ribbon-helix-helix domain-containing protein [Alphaproteobacteria bacterium]